MNNRNLFAKIIPTVVATILVASCQAPVYQDVSGLEEHKQPTDSVYTSSPNRTYDRYFYVRGEVMHQGPLQYVEATTLIQAVYAAGGFTASADSEHLLLRRPDGSVKRYSYTRILDRASENPEIYPGDILEVSKKKFFWWPW